MKTRFLILAIVIPVAIVGIIFSPLILEAYYLEKKYLQIGDPQDYENCTDTNECLEWLENDTCKTMLTTRCTIPEPKSEDDDDFEKTWSGPGNRHPAFWGFDIPKVCTEDMIKHLVKYSSMFDRSVPYGIEDIGFDENINVRDFDRCVEELLEKNPKELENEN